MDRNYKLDNLRAFAILIVVVGHSIILYDPSWGIYQAPVAYEPFRILKGIINTIQMPLFFSLSGFLFFFSAQKYSFSQLFLQKFKRIIIPFILILLFYNNIIKWVLEVPYSSSLVDFKQQILLGNLAHLWFLPVLFFCFLLSYYLTKVRNNRIQILIVFGLTSLSAVSSKLPRIFEISQTFHFLVYFYIGYIVSKFQLAARIEKLPILLLICCLGIFISIIYVLPQYYETSFVICAILIFYAIAPKRSYPILNLISSLSFGIYLFHSPLIYFTYTSDLTAHPWLVFFINFCVLGGGYFTSNLLLEENETEISDWRVDFLTLSQKQ